MSAADFEARLEGILDERYHHRHPFNLRMHDGLLREEEIRTWVRNRYYYQTRIPLKDTLIVDKSDDSAFQRQWTRRIWDHRGEPGRRGGLALWLGLAEAVGLDPEAVAALEDVLPGVRRACDAYVAFVESRDLLEGVAASLTEMRAGGLMARRIEAFAKHYPWVDRPGLAYFDTRTEQAPRDAGEALAFVVEHARDAADRDRCAAALERKCEILWSLLDAIEWAGHRPRLASRALRRERPEAMVVLPERAVELDAGAVEILDLCDGALSVGAIAGARRARYPRAANVEGDTYDFLERMQRLGVIETLA